ncbi:unnamed protein product [Citrullus colocynthis]|uniref:Uncharacterized protein n=1 Tax=Citrullus colocynthis TaxID=252529 RepID=A0ABP0YWE9_9ROSI
MEFRSNPPGVFLCVEDDDRNGFFARFGAEDDGWRSETAGAYTEDHDDRQPETRVAQRTMAENRVSVRVSALVDLPDNHNDNEEVATSIMSNKINSQMIL